MGGDMLGRIADTVFGASDEELAAAYGVAKEDTTCFTCPDKETCEWAWDPYNTDGDCLAIK